MYRSLPVSRFSRSSTSVTNVTKPIESSDEPVPSSTVSGSTSISASMIPLRRKLWIDSCSKLSTWSFSSMRSARAPLADLEGERGRRRAQTFEREARHQKVVDGLAFVPRVERLVEVQHVARFQVRDRRFERDPRRFVEVEVQEQEERARTERVPVDVADPVADLSDVPVGARVGDRRR